MFESLKKKLSTWLGTPEKKATKKVKKAKKEKKEKKFVKKAKNDKINKKPKKTIKEKITKKTLEKQEEEVEEKLEVLEKEEEQIEEQEEKEKPKESKGFFAKLKETLIGKEEPVEEIKIEKTEGKEILEEVAEVEEEEEIEEAEQAEEQVEEEKKEGFFSRLFKKVSSAKITEENFSEIFQELEMILLENNVALEVVDKIREDLSKSLIGSEITSSEAEEKITQALKNSILDVLIEPENLIEKINKKQDGPFVILFFGINGSGKTTSIAKLAHKLKKQNIPVVLAAADTFRAASIEQLQTHGKRLGIEVISKEYGSDPAAVAFDAIQYAKSNNIKVVLIDTAGRMYTKQNLMKEMEKIVRVSKPDLKIFVGESITGNDATEQAKTFNETAGIDGIILSKADVDDKAGTILSVSYVTKKPIYYLGVGQGMEDLQDFKKSTVLENLGLK